MQKYEKYFAILGLFWHEKSQFYWYVVILSMEQFFWWWFIQKLMGSTPRTLGKNMSKWEKVSKFQITLESPLEKNFPNKLV